MTGAERKDDLTKHEIEALKLLAGQPSEFDCWGAGLGVCLGFLRGMGLARLSGGRYEMTDAGHTALARLSDASKGE